MQCSGFVCSAATPTSSTSRRSAPRDPFVDQSGRQGAVCESPSSGWAMWAPFRRAASPGAAIEVIGVDVNPRKVAPDQRRPGAGAWSRGCPRRSREAIGAGGCGRPRRRRGGPRDRRFVDLRRHAVRRRRGRSHRGPRAGLRGHRARAPRAGAAAHRRDPQHGAARAPPSKRLSPRSSELRARGRRDFGFAVNPEYLREGTGVADFDRPEKTVIGELDAASGDAIAEIYGDLTDRIFRVPIRVAEAAKYVDNAFHALKVGFANEIGALSVEFGIDSHQLMEIFKADRKLNISDAYLTPGFCFGGSCLPKDLRALVHTGQGIARRRADPRERPRVERGPLPPHLRAADGERTAAGRAVRASLSSPAPTSFARARSSSWPSA